MKFHGKSSLGVATPEKTNLSSQYTCFETFGAKRFQFYKDWHQLFFFRAKIYQSHQRQSRALISCNNVDIPRRMGANVIDSRANICGQKVRIRVRARARTRSFSGSNFPRAASASQGLSYPATIFTFEKALAPRFLTCVPKFHLLAQKVQIFELFGANFCDFRNKICQSV